jgi:hypothetical protein
MRTSFTIFIILFVSLNVFAQERLITGVLKSSDGSEPLPGVNVQIKGTNIGTTTDANGHYSIRVPVGATLVFSFVGMQTREVVVGSEEVKKGNATSALKPLKKSKAASFPRSLLNDTIPNAPGVVTLSDDTPTHNGTVPKDPKWITGFRRLGSRYQILTYADLYRSTGYALQFTTAVGVDHVTALPELQSTFAQGRPDGGTNAWRGPEHDEIFSWGPLVKTPEYNGQSYPYDRNGMLVQAGTGNGKQAHNYSSNVFQTGLTNGNELTLSLPGPSQSAVLFDAESRLRSGVIPNSSYKKFNASLSVKNFNIHHLRVNGTLTFNDSRGNLLSHGANIASIIGAGYRTPATFDNANGLSSRVATYSSDAYRLEDEAIRSHAPGIADNPFGLMNELPDHDHLQRLIGMMDARYTFGHRSSINLNANTDRQLSRTTFGTPVGYSGYQAGRITQRQDMQWLSSLIIAPSFHPDIDNRITIGLVWHLQNDIRELKRADGFYLNNQMNTNDARILLNTGSDLSRFTHELSAKAEYNGDWLKLRFNGRSYFSNTVSTKRYPNFLPAISASVDLAEGLYLDPLNSLKIHASYARSVREAPLLYSNWSYLSTTMPVDRYSSLYESRELFFQNDLIPESERKLETGLSLSSTRVTLEFVYFNNFTDDFIAPAYDNDRYRLSNAAAIKNYGSSVSLDVRGSIPNGYWTSHLRWTKTYSRVMNVYGGNDFVPLAGFNTLQAVLAPGEPVGAIYGTTYRRNADDKIVIGADGFPLEDQTLKKIGDPIPDWILGWSLQASVRNFGLSFLFDFKRGGDVWNGTQSVLDYLGRSASTADLRQTSGFVFDGVDENNLPNTVPVSFADPEQPLSSNRWVRYGWDGVGEEYIEDASWIRLSEINLSYGFKRYSKTIKEIRFNLVGRNLFLITPYTGVDPSSTLFGYSTGSGLDLFNTPSIRSYNLQVTFKI